MNNMFVKDIIKEVKGTVYLLNGNKEIIYEYSNISSEDKEFENTYKALTGNIFDVEIANVVTDSRLAGKDNVYVAIKGERNDGNDFIINTFENGAVAAIGERSANELFKEADTKYTVTEKMEEDDEDIDIEFVFDNSDECAYIYIEAESSVYALGRIAHAYMDILDIPVVGITGSVGKTSAKETIASVLGERFNVGKTPGNLNNLIGLPLTCFTFDKNTEIAVVEMGVSEIGEMDHMTDIVKPDVAVITNIGVSHMENFGSREGIYNEKIKLANVLPESGVAVLNFDDDHLKNYKRDGITVRFYSMSKNGDGIVDEDQLVYADSFKSDGLHGSECKIRNLNIHNNLTDVDVKINVPGKHMVYPALQAAIVGAHFGLNAEDIANGIAKRATTNGRMNIIETEKGYTVIDDCYNASPSSMKAGIDTLTYADGRKICILGDMFELGADELPLHREIGEYVSDKNIDILITIGNLSKEMASAAENANGVTKVVSFEANEPAIEYIKSIIEKNDTVLIKASNSMKFSEIVDALK